MNEFTREELEQIAATDHVQCGDASALASMALAAMDSEPVGEFYEDGPLNWYQISEGDKVSDNRRIPLYRHAPPAPVVPTFDEWLEIRGNKPLGWVKDSMRESYDACRAAVLQGSQPVSNRDELPLDYLQGHKDGLEWAAQLAKANHPETGDWLYDDPIELSKAIRKGPDIPLSDGNSPVIQGGWIKCSERMPEDEQEVLTRNRMGHCFVSFFDEHSGLFFDKVDVAAACCIEHILVTHWMPLPAAPQQEE
ncbi:MULTISPECIES: DUF551 domain-containing protein [Citrobacter]|uniref:DUF551 domain-containing protein n=1 Tax=Citrobacter TaxID=544 RepID=UPI0018A93D93|nr:DUF551 domain-containing protein [Citrobacter farmeri]MDB2181905.1 DUF551 domain-containing protein [Citrobacter farmeri]HBU6573964.1 DUF551 domain-containing protein [Citrobacter amalonaticus]